MPKTVILPDPDGLTTIGTVLSFVRQGTGAAGVLIRYDVPGEPNGTFETTASALSAGAKTNLQAIHAEIIALFKTANGYT